MYSEGNRKNKTALVTGAAQGIGRAFAENLANQGYNLVVVDIQKDKVFEFAEQLRKNHNIQVHRLHLDLSQIDAAETVYDFCQKNNIEIDILINNAGEFIFESITEIEIDRYNAVLQLHVNTPAKLCKYFGNDMKLKRNGHILIVASLSAWMPYPYIALYASTKKFLRMFARTTHFEFSKYNVGVITICPGAVDTDLVKMKPEQRKMAKKLGIMMSPELLAKRSLKKMYSRRITYIPGLINRIFLFFLLIIPARVVSLFYKK